jgi:acrylyl-CoA reductase (NADPH)
MSIFKAMVVDKTETGQQAVLRSFDEADLMEGDVTVCVTHSTVNYKDGLALAGKGNVVRRFPMIPGVDLAGRVETSTHPDFNVGDAVVLNGWGVGESHLGAYAGKARVKGDWLIPLPPGLTAAQAMAIGTAGYTAMLCVMAIERHGLTPDRGPVIVTGAAGGVGSVAVTLLAKAGWHVVASTGRPQESAYLKDLGATEVIDRQTLSAPSKPLAKERWAAGVDSVGSSTLASVLAMTQYGGAITSCGLAGGMDLPTTVAPFILRGVALLGVDSVRASRTLRLEAWNRLATELDLDRLAVMTTTIALEGVEQAGHDILAGKVRGRIVVQIAEE